MALLGQASGAWTESSSALRILYVGVRNSVGILTDDAFTQTNPPIVTATSTISSNVDTSLLGVLSGSVAFTRPDEGSNYIGGNAEGLATATHELHVRPLGLFINNAAGNSFENQPGAASGKGPYTSSQGTHASQLFETALIGDLATATGDQTGEDIVYTTGASLIASRNGYLMPAYNITDTETMDIATLSAEVEHGQTASTTIAILKMPSDSTQSEIVFDQRI